MIQNQKHIDLSTAIQSSEALLKSGKICTFEQIKYLSDIDMNFICNTWKYFYNQETLLLNSYYTFCI